MRVIEPNKPVSAKPASGRSYFKYILVIIPLLAIIGASGWYYIFRNQPANKNSQANSNSMANFPPDTAKKGTLKIFKAQEFRDLYNNFAYPNTERISEKTPITGNIGADDHIRAMAKERGYTLRSAPVADVFQEVEPDMKLQQRAAQPWVDMQAAAKKNNIAIGLSAAYRSAEEQTEIFTSRLAVNAINIDRIASGVYDKQIAAVLQTTAVPGYSRHHTGYTIDIICTKTPGASFLTTDCFKWLSSDNYKNAKTYGWIPSYPEGTGMQGPEPEAWEYVWVGVDAVTE